MRQNPDLVKKTLSTAKIIVVAEELKNNNKEISITTIKNTAKEKNIDIDNITYPSIVKILKENNYEFTKVLDRNKFAQRRIEMAELTRKGWTLQMIGDKYGITRQAVSLLLKKAAANDNQIVVKAKTKRSDPNEKNVVLVKRYKKESRNCTCCGKEFFSKNKRKTCSKACFKKLIVGGEWSRTEMVDLVCNNCGKAFQRTKYLQKIILISKKNSKNNYCSKLCYHTKSKSSPSAGNVS